MTSSTAVSDYFAGFGIWNQIIPLLIITISISFIIYYVHKRSKLK